MCPIFGPEAVLTTPENIVKIDHLAPAIMTIEQIVACINYGLAAKSVEHLLVADKAVKMDDSNPEKIALLRDLTDAKRLVAAYYYTAAEQAIPDRDESMRLLLDGWRIQQTILEGSRSQLSDRKRKVSQQIAKTHNIDVQDVALTINDFEAWAV